MRTPRNNPKAMAAQSQVKAQFEQLNWGVAPNPEHDLGTDHWLMARDERGFETQRLVGVQVKTGKTRFKSGNVDGVDGWWYREGNDDHFQYWSTHSIPHILAWHDSTDGNTYWVHVTQDRVKTTGKGRKVFVPNNQTVDEEHRTQLMEVALSDATLPDFQGSAWDSAASVSAADELRYALLAPRLIAPHRSRGTQQVSIVEAVALLSQMRIRDIDVWTEVEPRLNANTASNDPAWRWQFYAALSIALVSGELDALRVVVALATAPADRAAGACTLASLLFEDEAIDEALTVVTGALTPDDLEPVDHAWVEVHRARMFAELGQFQEAKKAALHVVSIAQMVPVDPTAAILSGAAAGLIFNLNGWDADSLIAAIRSSDNMGSWWRSQTLVSGLAAHVDEAYIAWAEDKTQRWSSEDTAWLQLRSSMLLAGYAADTGGWRGSASLLARRMLTSTDDTAQVRRSLDLLRIGGSDDHIKMTVGRLMARGPVDPLVDAASECDLAAVTRGALQSSIRLVTEAADVLTAPAADRHARWAIAVLADSTDLRNRVRPTFHIENELIELLRRVSVSVSPEVEVEIRNHVTKLPPIQDHLLAQSYGRLIEFIDDDGWTPKQLKRLGRRGASDLPLLGHSIERLVAITDPDRRAGLLERISNGDAEALRAFGNVSELDTGTASAAIQAVSGHVRERVLQAASGVHAFGGHDPLCALALLNIWHPSVSCWGPVEEALAHPDLRPERVVGTIRLLGRAAEDIDGQTALRLRDAIETRIDMSQGANDSWSMLPDPADVRGIAAVALAQLFPDSIADVTVARLAWGNSSQRAAAARICAHLERPELVMMLAALGGDTEPDVRAAVARTLAIWVAAGTAYPESTELLERLLDGPGTKVALAVSETFKTHANPNLEPILSRLSGNSSAIVRWRTSAAISGLT